MWRGITGDNSMLYVVSEGEVWSQPRQKALRFRSVFKASWDMLKSQAFYENAKAKASNDDNQRLSSTIMVALAVVVVVSVLLFGVIILKGTLE